MFSNTFNPSGAGVDSIPFGLFADIQPFTWAGGTKVPYAGTIPRSGILTGWRQGFFVAGANDSSNYWSFLLTIAGGAGIDAEISTMLSYANANNQWTAQETISFTSNVLDIALRAILYLRVTPTGAPGTLYVSGSSVYFT